MNPRTLNARVILHPRAILSQVRRLGGIPMRTSLVTPVAKVELLIHPEISTHNPVHTPATLEKEAASKEQIRASLPESDGFPCWAIWFGEKLGAGFWLNDERDPRVKACVPGVECRRSDAA